MMKGSVKTHFKTVCFNHSLPAESPVCLPKCGLYGLGFNVCGGICYFLPHRDDNAAPLPFRRAESWLPALTTGLRRPRNWGVKGKWLSGVDLHLCVSILLGGRQSAKMGLTRTVDFCQNAGGQWLQPAGFNSPDCFKVLDVSSVSVSSCFAFRRS